MKDNQLKNLYRFLKQLNSKEDYRQFLSGYFKNDIIVKCVQPIEYMDDKKYSCEECLDMVFSTKKQKLKDDD